MLAPTRCRYTSFWQVCGQHVAFVIGKHANANPGRLGGEQHVVIVFHQAHFQAREQPQAHAFDVLVPQLACAIELFVRCEFMCRRC